jgi:IS1 family transposase
MRVIPRERKVAIIHGLCNGMSLRSASRVFDTHRTAIQNLLVRVGDRCERLLDEHMCGLDLRYLEIDELWTFCGKKQARLTDLEIHNPNLGDQYLFLAIDHESKCIPAWSLGKRNRETAVDFLTKLRGSLNGTKPQVSSDAWGGYEDTLDEVFGLDLDHATVTKDYESEWTGRGRYAPPRVSHITKTTRIGTPDPERICTSIVERTNLSVRTMQRRFTRLSLGFSRKMENLHAACALHVAYYDFVWQPRTLHGTTPAMAAGATDRLWDVSDLVGDC